MTTPAPVSPLDEVVAVSRYPLEPGDPGRRTVVEQARSELDATGATQLEGFLTPAAVHAIVAVARAHVGSAHRTEARHNVYFDDDAPTGPEDPRHVPVRSAKRALGWNHVPAGSPLRALYESDAVLALVRDILGMGLLFHDADPVGACSLMYYDAGDELGWHFDNSDFAVTLMLQDSTAGGVFEYFPNIRSETDQQQPAVAAVLRGDRGGVRTLRSAPGTLSLFRGRHSLHRVTPVEGTTQRINAVLAYAGTPGHTLTPLTRELFYGNEP